MALFCADSPNSVAFRAHYVKVAEDTRQILQVKRSPENIVLAIYHLWQYSTGITPSEGVKVKRPPVASEKLTNNQS